MEKIIWFYWHQGIDKAPVIVKKCLQSWKKYNPEWDIRVLDERTSQQYINIDFLKQTQGNAVALQAYADILRLNLVYKYGGIWVDASSFCCVPLDTWVHSAINVSDGFICIQYPDGDKLIDNWFLASNKNSWTSKMCVEFAESYIQKHRYKEAINTRIGRKFLRWSQKDRNRTMIWFKPFVQDFLKIRPYFFFQYGYYFMTKTSKKFKDRHNKMYCINAKEANFKFHGFFDRVKNTTKNEIINRRVKIYKLRWKDWPEKFELETSIGFLLKEHELL
jgi:mannosyltransferase OCH1-like enzyme